MINWKVRFANKDFWKCAIPALLLLVQATLKIFNVEIDLGEIGNKLLAFVNALFMFLAIIGVVNDPTTQGLTDSTRALQYDTPYSDENQTGQNEGKE